MIKILALMLLLGFLGLIPFGEARAGKTCMDADGTRTAPDDCNYTLIEGRCKLSCSKGAGQGGGSRGTSPTPGGFTNSTGGGASGGKGGSSEKTPGKAMQAKRADREKAKGTLEK